jgi:ssDNA-binding Zn-finger/Zn-ribbon topoisomerase 1
MISDTLKINTVGFMEQDIPWRCPECDFEMVVLDIIGYGDYPKGGYRNQMKPNKTDGLAYECPECFSKSISHMHSEMIIDMIDIANHAITKGKTREELKVF